MAGHTEPTDDNAEARMWRVFLRIAQVGAAQ